MGEDLCGREAGYEPLPVPLTKPATRPRTRRTQRSAPATSCPKPGTHLGVTANGFVTSPPGYPTLITPYNGCLRGKKLTWNEPIKPASLTKPCPSVWSWAAQPNEKPSKLLSPASQIGRAQQSGGSPRSGPEPGDEARQVWPVPDQADTPAEWPEPTTDG